MDLSIVGRYTVFTRAHHAKGAQRVCGNTILDGFTTIQILTCHFRFC